MAADYRRAPGSLRTDAERRRCTSATPAPRCWRGSRRAPPAGAWPCASTTSTSSAAGRSTPPAVVDDLAWLGLDWDGEVLVQSTRGARVRRRRSRRSRPAGWSTSATAPAPSCARARPARRTPTTSSAPPYPGTCRELTTAERAERRAAGRGAALRLRVPRGPVRFEDVLHGSGRGGRRGGRRLPAAAHRRAARLRPGDGRGRRGDGRHGRPARRRPARPHRPPGAAAAPARRCRRPATATCRCCTGRTAPGWPSATAP